MLSPRDNSEIDKVPRDAGFDRRIDNVYVGNVLSTLISVIDFLTTNGSKAPVSLAKFIATFKEGGALVHLVELLKSCSDGCVLSLAPPLFYMPCM